MTHLGKNSKVRADQRHGAEQKSQSIEISTKKQK
jgi:hypothetical protein